jgi:hypothetical protein
MNTKPFVLTEELNEAVETMCAIENTDIGAFINRAIVSYIKERKNDSGFQAKFHAYMDRLTDEPNPGPVIPRPPPKPPASKMPMATTSSDTSSDNDDEPELPSNIPSNAR